MSKNRIIVDLVNTEAIYDWSKPTSLSDVRSFISLADYCKCFFNGFATIAVLMTQFNQKEVSF